MLYALLFLHVQKKVFILYSNIFKLNSSEVNCSQNLV